MDTTTIKQEIDDNVKPNGTGAITGQVLNDTLNDMVDAITPKFYSEDPETNRVTIENDEQIIIHGVEDVLLSTAGYRLTLSEEEGIIMGFEDDVTLEIKTNSGVRINDERVLTDSDLSFVSRILGVDRFWDNVQYTIGDLVLYQYVLYKFTVDHLGAWNFSDVQETNLRELLNF